MAHVLVQAEYGLYPYQREVVNALLSSLTAPVPAGVDGSSGRVVAHLPTGAGKTRVASHVACQLLNQGLRGDRGLLVWLANSSELCDQAADELARAWSYLGRWNANVYRFWGNYDTELEWISGGFLVASLQKMWASSRRDRTPLVGLSSIAAGVVFDEAHQAVAPTYESMVNALLSERPPLLGLTATPGRGSVLGGEDVRLADLFRINKVGIDPKGHPNVVAFLVEGGYLARAVFKQVEVDSGGAGGEQTSGGDYSDQMLARIGTDEGRLARVVELVESALKVHRRVMVFCPSVPNAVATGQVLEQQGLSVGVVASGTSSEERAEIVARYRSGDHTPMALLNYGVFTAGFDAPATSCVIIARPTLSVVLYSQMAGRAMRGPLSGGNRVCEVWTVVDTDLRGFRSVADSFENWEELWL